MIRFMITLFILTCGLALAQTTVYVADSNSILAVDLATGARTLVTSSTLGSGPILNNISGICAENSNNLLVVDQADGSGPIVGRLMRINILTGDRSVVSQENVQSGPWPGFCNDLATNQSDAFLMSRSNYTNYPGIVAINLADGSRRVVLAPSSPSELLISESFCWGPDQRLHYLRLDSLIYPWSRLNPSNQNVTTVGTTLPTSGVYRIALEQNGSMIAGAGPNNRYIYRVDAQSGQSTRLAISTDGNGSSFLVADLEIASNQIYIADSSRRTVFRIDGNTGARIPVSSNPENFNVGSGPNFKAPRRLAAPAGLQGIVARANDNWHVYH